MMTESTAIALLVLSIVTLLWAVIGLIKPKLAKFPNRLASVGVWAVSFGMLVFSVALISEPPDMPNAEVDSVALISEPSNAEVDAALPRSPDRVVLVAFYEATNGANWADSENWLTDASLSSWHGVNIDPSGRVTELDLSGNDLHGEIPPELGTLTHLR